MFVGLLFLVKIMAMHPSGRYVMQYPLWAYYGVMAPRLFRPSVLGPASGNASRLVETGVTHVLLSAAGGCAAVAVGWCVRRLQGRKAG